jgi:hypothetical protein
MMPAVLRIFGHAMLENHLQLNLAEAAQFVQQFYKLVIALVLMR